MNLIDTHTHLFTEAFDSDRPSVMGRALEAGVTYMILPNIDAESVESVLQTLIDFPSTRAMWGLHPCHVFAGWEAELDRIEPLLDTYPPVAIGEIGLDYYWSREFMDQQKTALTRQLHWALDRGLPVSLHTREATSETIDMVEPFARKGLTGVFHCFSGDESEASRITGMGFALGIGGSITYKKNPVRDFIQRIPPAHLVLETDAPYLPPVPYRGKRNEPSYLREIVAELAFLVGKDPAEIARITSENARAIFHLNS